MAYPPLTGLFAERYVIERELGHGATAVVYLAHDNKHNREIALKVLSKDLAHALGPERFLREIQFTTRLHHPHILPIFDSGEWNGMLYYVLPYVRGESLRQKIDRETQLPIEECVRITCEVADALAHAHSQGIVHRDVKPENIMLSEGHALLADFGIARTLDVHTGERLTSSGLIVGTSAYMSPEQAAGEEKIDARSDIYSLACVLYEMIAGVQAFTGPTTQSVIAQRFKHTPRPVSTYRPQVPEYLETALTRALAISPADRYSTIRKFAAELPDVPSAGSDRRRSPIRRLVHERQKAFGFAAAAVVVLSAAFVTGNPGDWRTLFSRHAALDSTRYIVLPSPSEGHTDIGAKDLDAVAHLTRAMQKWNGVALVDPQVVSDAVASKRLAQSGDAFDLAKRNGAGRLIRVNATGDASVADVATGTVLNEVSTADLKGARDSSAATALKLLSAKDRPRLAEGGDGLTTSFTAWSAYGRAHAAMRRRDYSDAQLALAAALNADGHFAPARLWSAQLAQWLQPGARDEWKADASRAASADSLSPRDRVHANALAALAAGRFDDACAAYRKLIATDSADITGWLGLGECQRLDERVVPSRASPSGFRFRSSYQGAASAFLRAVAIDPGAFDLIGYDRMRRIKPVEASLIRKGGDAGNNRFFAYPSWQGDTVAYVPYPPATFTTLPASALATRRIALENNLTSLLELTRTWVRSLPESPNGYEALATVLEARGEIDARDSRDISASDAVRKALQFSRSRSQSIRLRATEFRLRVKRGDFASAKMLSDSILADSGTIDRSAVEEMIGVAAATGRIALTARLATQMNYIPPDIGGIHIPPQIAAASMVLLAHAALGDCSARTSEARASLDRLVASYLSEKEAAIAKPALESRALSLLAPCTRAASVLGVPASRDPLVRMQQAFAAGEISRVRSIADSLAPARRNFRPSDMSLDYTYQEAWLTSATGDTAGAITQLDESLNALPMIGRGTLHELAGAAALGRAMALRADLALAKHDASTSRKYARNVAELWSGADAEVQPLVTRMKRMAGTGR